MGKTTHERRCFLTFKHGDFRWQTVRWPKGNGIMRGLFYDIYIYTHILHSYLLAQPRTEKKRELFGGYRRCDKSVLKHSSSLVSSWCAMLKSWVSLSHRKVTGHDRCQGHTWLKPVLAEPPRGVPVLIGLWGFRVIQTCEFNRHWVVIYDQWIQMVDGFRYLVVSAPQTLDDDPQTCRGGLKLCPLQPQLVLPPWQVLPHGQLQHVNKSSSHAWKAGEICHEYSWAVSKAHWFIVNMGVLLTSRRGISQQSTIAIAMPVTLGVQAPVEESSHLLGGSGLARDRMKIPSAFSARIGKMIHSDLCSPSSQRHDGGTLSDPAKCSTAAPKMPVLR